MKTPKQLSREAIDEFKAIYKDEFGEDLTDDEVREIATRLLRFFGILTRDLRAARGPSAMLAQKPPSSLTRLRYTNERGLPSE